MVFESSETKTTMDLFRPNTPHHQPAFKFCPGCGLRRDTSSPSPDVHWPEPKRLDCKSCGFTLFLNSAAAVLGLLYVDATKLAAKRPNIGSDLYMLVAIRAHEPKRFCLDVPGGFVDPGEGAEEALLRELEEEVGGLAVISHPAAETQHKNRTLATVSRGDLNYVSSMSNLYPYRGVAYHPCDIT